MPLPVGSLGFRSRGSANPTSSASSYIKWLNKRPIQPKTENCQPAEPKARLFAKMGLEVLQFDRGSLRKILRPMFDQNDPTKSRYYKKQ